MVISMVVVVLGALVWVAIVPRINQAPTQSVPNPAGIAREVGGAQKWDVALPQGLSGWTPVNVRLLRITDQPPMWHAGYKAPSGQFAALDQVPRSTPDWISGRTGTSTTSGTVTLAGQRWDRYEEKGRRSLVRAEPLAGLATVVSGDVEWDELQRFAAALRPTRAASASSTGSGASSTPASTAPASTKAPAGQSG